MGKEQAYRLGELWWLMMSSRLPHSARQTNSGINAGRASPSNLPAIVLIPVLDSARGSTIEWLSPPIICPLIIHDVNLTQFEPQRPDESWIHGYLSHPFTTTALWRLPFQNEVPLLHTSFSLVVTSLCTRPSCHGDGFLRLGVSLINDKL